MDNQPLQAILTKETLASGIDAEKHAALMEAFHARRITNKDYKDGLERLVRQGAIKTLTEYLAVHENAAAAKLWKQLCVDEYGEEQVLQAVKR